jgi:hypothetical protein
MAGDRHDPVLIVGKAIGLSWASVARLDPAPARAGPDAIANGYRERAIELRAPDAFDRGAGSGLLADPAVGVMGMTATN